jgi:hypothetical protein
MDRKEEDKGDLRSFTMNTCQVFIVFQILSLVLCNLALFKSEFYIMII